MKTVTLGLQPEILQHLSIRKNRKPSKGEMRGINVKSRRKNGRMSERFKKGCLKN